MKESSFIGKREEKYIKQILDSSGFKNVKILDFWYGFKNEIAIGKRASIANPDKAKNLALTPANHATTTPPAAIKIDVPRSGWEITRITGNNMIARTKVILAREFTFSIFIRW